jgi:serine carboxypeptidase-like clade 2
LQEIGPYYLEDGSSYKPGDMLTENKNSWHKISNLLFLESPAGVGFSFNTDSKFEYNDVQTANDNLLALMAFYTKFPEYQNRGLWIAGESYAGKYIPDLAQLIIQSNEQKKSNIKLKGILIGNGIISFDYLSVSEIEFMVARSFVDPETLQYWRSSCQTDADSAGCQFFLKRYTEDVR